MNIEAIEPGLASASSNGCSGTLPGLASCVYDSHSPFGWKERCCQPSNIFRSPLLVTVTDVAQLYRATLPLLSRTVTGLICLPLMLGRHSAPLLLSCTPRDRCRNAYQQR